jgi:hypothetical protein
MTRTHRRRLLAFAGGLTLVVGLLTGFVDALTIRSLYGPTFAGLEPAISGPAARFGARYVEGVGVVGVLTLYVLLPFAVAYVSTRGDERRPSFHYAWAVAAVAWLPVLAVAVAVSGLGNPYTPPVRLVVGVAIPVVFSAGLVAAHRFALARSPDDVDRRPPLAVFANLAFVVLFVAGVWLGTVAGGPAGTLVERSDGAVPQAVFAFSETETADGTVLEVTHDGGDPIQVESLRIVGEGFENVSGTDRTEPGPWPASEATGPDGPTVVTNDSVTVGVADDCDIRVVIYRRGVVWNTLGKHACGGQ